MSDLDEIKRGLLDDLESFIGEPVNKRNSNRKELRWYPNGGLSMVRSGAKRGSWIHHASGEGGGPFQLIQYFHRCDFPAAIAWAKSYLGITDDGSWKHCQTDAARDRERAKAQAKATEAEEGEMATGIANARSWWAGSVPLAGTLGAIYLTKTRGIPVPASGWPHAAVRYHPSSQSLIVAATTVAGAVHAIQRIRLGSDARKLANGKDAKRSAGPQEGALVRLPGDPDGPLLIAEGPETGLSAWAATSHETWISLGTRQQAARSRTAGARARTPARPQDPGSATAAACRGACQDRQSPA